MNVSIACFTIGGLVVLGAFFSGMLTGEGIYYTAVLVGFIIIIVGFFISRKKRQKKTVENNEGINNVDGRSFESNSKKTKLGIKKKIGLGIGIFFGIMIILGAIGSNYNSSVENSETQVTSSHAPNIDSNIVTESEFESLRPTREDIGTAWQETQDITYNDVSYVYKRMHGEGQDDMRHFTSLWSIGYVKGSGYDTSLLDIQIYRFETDEKAGNFYNQFLGYYKEMGGYDEWDTNIQGCYGSKVQGTMMDKVAMYCLKGNVATFLSSAGMDKYDLEKRLPEIASNINSKF